MESMASHKKYPPEFKERAVRMLREWRRSRNRSDGGFPEVAGQLGIHVESLRAWVRQAEVDGGERPGVTTVDGGERPGVTTEEKARIAELERENFELRRANEILKSAAVFFGVELDRRRTK
jgi:transposase